MKKYLIPIALLLFCTIPTHAQEAMPDERSQRIELLKNHSFEDEAVVSVPMVRENSSEATCLRVLYSGGLWQLMKERR